MGINEEERLNDEIAKLFYVVCQRFYISFFDENLLHRIVSDAVSDVQNPSNWTEVPEGGVREPSIYELGISREKTPQDSQDEWTFVNLEEGGVME